MIRLGAAALIRSRARVVAYALEVITRVRTRVTIDDYSTRVSIDG